MVFIIVLRLCNIIYGVYCVDYNLIVLIFLHIMHTFKLMNNYVIIVVVCEKFQQIIHLHNIKDKE